MIMTSKPASQINLFLYVTQPHVFCYGIREKTNKVLHFRKPFSLGWSGISGKHNCRVKTVRVSFQILCACQMNILLQTQKYGPSPSLSVSCPYALSHTPTSQISGNLRNNFVEFSLEIKRMAELLVVCQSTLFSSSRHTVTMYLMDSTDLVTKFWPIPYGYTNSSLLFPPANTL